MTTSGAAPGYRLVDVPGGALTVARWGEGRPATLAVHGITASHLAWAAVAAAATATAAHPMLAVDLRGRGASSGLPGPFGLARHADDLAAVLDAEGVEQVVVAGHSMGGFVAVALAVRHPERVRRLVLVDGGLPLPAPPEGMAPEQVLQATLGPALARLVRRFASIEEYRGFWQAHPALSGAWDETVQAYVDYDLVGEPPALRSRVSADAVRADHLDMLTGDYPALFAAVRQPAVMLRAPRGLQDQPEGLYPEQALTEWTRRLPNLTGRTVPDVNHYTILFAPRGAAEVAAELSG
jgi:lipase